MAKKPAYPKLSPGDYVLIGRPGISMPDDWLLATVICVAGDEVGYEHSSPSNGERYRQFEHLGYVRAVGPIAALVDFQAKARVAVEAERKVVSDLESQLGAARTAVWKKLDEISASVPQFEPAGAE